MAKVHDSENTVFAFEIVPVGGKLPTRHCVIPRGRNSRKPFSPTNHSVLQQKEKKWPEPKNRRTFWCPIFFLGRRRADLGKYTCRQRGEAALLFSSSAHLIRPPRRQSLEKEGRGRRGKSVGDGKKRNRHKRERERKQEQDLFNDPRWLTLNNFAGLTFGQNLLKINLM